MKICKKNSCCNNSKLLLSLCFFVYILLCIILTQKCDTPHYIILSDIMYFINQITSIVLYSTKEALCKIYLFPNIYITFSLKYNHSPNTCYKAYIVLMYKK